MRILINMYRLSQYSGAYRNTHKAQCIISNIQDEETVNILENEILSSHLQQLSRSFSGHLSVSSAFFIGK